MTFDYIFESEFLCTTPTIVPLPKTLKNYLLFNNFITFMFF